MQDARGRLRRIHSCKSKTSCRVELIHLWSAFLSSLPAPEIVPLLLSMKRSAPSESACASAREVAIWNFITMELLSTLT